MPVLGANHAEDAEYIWYGGYSLSTPATDLDSAGEPTGGFGEIYSTAWWKVEVPVTETVGVSLLHSSVLSTRVNVYTGEPGSLSLVTSASDPEMFFGIYADRSDFDFNGVAGQTYYIQVGSEFNYSGNPSYYNLKVGKRLEERTDWLEIGPLGSFPDLDPFELARARWTGWKPDEYPATGFAAIVDDAIVDAMQLAPDLDYAYTYFDGWYDLSSTSFDVTVDGQGWNGSEYIEYELSAFYDENHNEVTPYTGPFELDYSGAPPGLSHNIFVLLSGTGPRVVPLYGAYAEYQEPYGTYHEVRSRLGAVTPPHVWFQYDNGSDANGEVTFAVQAPAYDFQTETSFPMGIPGVPAKARPSDVIAVVSAPPEDDDIVDIAPFIIPLDADNPSVSFHAWWSEVPTTVTSQERETLTGWDFRVNAVLSVTEGLEWLYEPPPHRWVIRTVEQLPEPFEELPIIRAVRQYPRDDVGGFNGSPRIFPAPKNNRLFGGFMRLALSAVGELVRLDTLLRGLTVPGEPAR